MFLLKVLLCVSLLCEKEERKEFALTEKTILAGKKRKRATRKKNSSLFFLSFFLSFSLKEE